MSSSLVARSSVLSGHWLCQAQAKTFGFLPGLGKANALTIRYQRVFAKRRPITFGLLCYKANNRSLPLWSSRSEKQLNKFVQRVRAAPNPFSAPARTCSPFGVSADASRVRGRQIYKGFCVAIRDCSALTPKGLHVRAGAREPSTYVQANLMPKSQRVRFKIVLKVSKYVV